MRFAVVLALVSSASASLWCYSSDSLCESQLTDCEYYSDLSEWCGTVTKA